MANLYEKLLEAWTSAEDKETKFQQLLESWIKAVDAKNTYRQLLNHWVDTDEHIKNKFEALLTEWSASEVKVPHQAVLDDWAGYENRKANPREDWLQEIVDNASKTEQFKHWLEEWIASAK